MLDWSDGDALETLRAALEGVPLSFMRFRGSCGSPWSSVIDAGPRNLDHLEDSQMLHGLLDENIDFAVQGTSDLRTLQRRKHRDGDGCQIRHSPGTMASLNALSPGRRFAFSSEAPNLEVPLGTTFENVQNKFSQPGRDRCTAL